VVFRTKLLTHHQQARKTWGLRINGGELVVARKVSSLLQETLLPTRWRPQRYQTRRDCHQSRICGVQRQLIPYLIPLAVIAA
tara:strand:+ start:307 stop:552 length:246 start_codon:yes stop_codon:yes gene_type:complete